MPPTRQWPWEEQETAVRSAQQAALNAHKRDRLKSVFLPVAGAALVLFGGAAVAFFVPRGVGVHKAASVTIIFASALCLLGGLPILAVLGIAIYFTARLTATTPSFTENILVALANIQRSLNKAAVKSALPIIKIQSTASAITALFRSLTDKPPLRRNR